MAVPWTDEEFDLLVAFYFEEGPRPRPRALERLRDRLLEGARVRIPDLVDEHFRTLDGLRVQLYRLRLVATEDPRARDRASRPVFEAWERRARMLDRGEPLVTFGLVDAVRAGGARADLATFLTELEKLLGDFVEQAPRLMGQARADNFEAAWEELRSAGNFARAQEALFDPRADEELQRVGLVGSQLHAKWEGFKNALKRLADGWTWERLRPSLRWANLLLGSLGSALPFSMVDAIAEFKEIGEISAEEAAGEGAFEPV
jgi:hypothetical protein